MRALVTGGSRGIGLAIVERLAHEGIEVSAPGRSELDLADSSSVEAFLAQPENRTFDILVNNAGENIILPLQDIPLETWRHTHTVNLESPFRILQANIPYFKQKRWGRVVNISSIYGIVSREGRASYASTKGAIISLTRTSAIELGNYGVLVNAVCPGFIETELTRKNNPPEVLAKLIEQVPLKKLGQPKDVAEFVWFLCSPQNQFITGQALPIDGGFLAQ
jgi:3-oxoacyl-[acyl-carrier protein] reductase